MEKIGPVGLDMPTLFRPSFFRVVHLFVIVVLALTTIMPSGDSWTVAKTITRQTVGRPRKGLDKLVQEERLNVVDNIQDGCAAVAPEGIPIPWSCNQQ